MFDREAMRWETLVKLLTTFLLQWIHALATRKEDLCRFPTKWEGTWFQSGVRSPITIELNRLSNKGRCLAADGDKFLVVDDKGVCYRCVVIHEKHANALQYKETFCHGRSNLNNLCSLITGDALLYSMFRLNAQPVHCPFKAPMTFTYNRGHGECRNPVSNIESCIDESKLVLRYQACPDVSGTESTVEELECLATWKEGSSRYLVGKVSHRHVTSNEDSFRCFVYEKTANLAEQQQQEEMGGRLGGGGGGGSIADTSEYRIAQSGDATCNGLFSPMEGSRTLTLKKASAPLKCKFPTWLTSNQHWHTLDYRKSYTFHHKNTTLKITNNSAVDLSTRSGSKHHIDIPEVIVTPLGLKSSSADNSEIRLICSEVKHANYEQTNIVAHFTMGCQSGYVCLWLYRRDLHVIEIQSGDVTSRLEEACHSLHFDKTLLPYVTLVTTSPETKECPNQGKFDVTSLSSEIDRSRREAIVVPQDRTKGGRGRRRRRSRRDRREENNYEFSDRSCTGDVVALVVGCGTNDVMEFTSDCSQHDIVSAYSCHGRWSDNETNYLITTPQSRTSIGAKRYCFIYKQMNGVYHFSSSSSTCVRNINPGVGGLISFNATLTGRCMEASPAVHSSTSDIILILMLTLLSVLLSTAR